MSGMLPLPSVLKIGPIKYQVTSKKWKKKTNMLGETYQRKQTIQIREGLLPDRLAETLLHEALHCMLGQMGYLEENEEALVTALSPILLLFLRENPDVWEFLLEEEG